MHLLGAKGAISDITSQESERQESTHSQGAPHHMHFYQTARLSWRRLGAHLGADPHEPADL